MERINTNIVNSEGKKLVTNFSSVFVMQIANYIIPMISVPIIVRIVGPEKFGIINYAAAVVSYFALLVNFSFNLTAAGEIAKNKHNAEKLQEIFNKVFSTKLWLFCLSTIVFSALLIVSPSLHDRFTILWATYLICIGWVFTPDWLYQGMGNLHFLAIFNLFSKIVFTGLTVVMIRKPEDFFWQPLALSLVQLAFGFSSWLFSLYRYKIVFRLYSLRVAMLIIRKDLVIFSSTVIITIYTTANILILQVLSNSKEVGYFAAAQKFILISQSLVTLPISQTIFPHIASAFGKSQAQGLQTVIKMTPLIAVATFVFSLFLIVVGPFFISVFYGSQFEKSRMIFSIMSMIPFLVTLSNIFGVQIMLNMGMKEQFFKIVTFGAIASVVLNVVLVKIFASLGSGLAWILSEMNITLTMGIFLYRKNIVLFQPKDLIRVLSFQGISKILLNRKNA